MAGTKNTAHVVQLKPVEVPKCMQDGEKFIKWDEVMSKSLEGKQQLVSHTNVVDIGFLGEAYVVYILFLEFALLW